ncbi:MAG: succinate dehydrogenase iron-sulfur subunit [Deltaproteobacteria bacterium]|nr:succinate dehydrogenase iron-sulfur subunit [Deltaproteobacteria bacterium]
MDKSGPVRLQIRRQEGPGAAARWEDFEVPRSPTMNVITCLQLIQKTPVDASGRRTDPVVWDCNCLEEVCGACSLLVNGRARQACTALVSNLSEPIVLEPLSKFPVVRDLMVDRTSLFDSLKRVKAWVPIDGTYDLGPGPRLAEKDRAFGYRLSRCMTCGVCLESCPQVHPGSSFMGPAPLAQALYFNTSPIGRMNAEERLEAAMGEGGVMQCGNAQNCARACPKEVPLTTAIAALNRATTLHYLKSWFTR